MSNANGEPVIDPISGKLGASEPAPVVKPRSKLPQQTIVMAIVLAVSAVSIFGMRTLGMKAGIAFGDQAIDYTPPDSEKARTYERIMTDLARVQTPLDVALGEFGKSPFMLQQQVPKTPGVAEALAGPTPEQKAAEEAKRRAEERRLYLEDSLSKIRLQGVMNGPHPLARIDGETRRLGDQIGDDFVIKRIEDRTVILTADGRDFSLTLEAVNQGPKAPPMKMGKPSGKK